MVEAWNDPLWQDPGSDPGLQYEQEVKIEKLYDTFRNHPLVTKK